MYKLIENDIAELSQVAEPQIEFNFKVKKEVNEIIKKKTYKVVSLFSGCGGLDLGFSGGFDFRNRHFEKNKFKI